MRSVARTGSSAFAEWMVLPQPAAMSSELVRGSPTPPSREVAISVVKSAIAAIPFVGQALNEALFDARSRIKQNRLNAFFQSVATSVAALQESALDRDYITSEEFSDLMEDLTHRVANTRAHEKRERFRRVLLTAMQGRRSPNFEPMYLTILQEITEEELCVLAGFHHVYRERLKRPNEDLGIAPIDYSASEIGGHAPHIYRTLLQSLIRKGLLFDDSHGRLSTDPYVVVEYTDLGMAFYEWLEG